MRLRLRNKGKACEKNVPRIREEHSHEYRRKTER
jgi:hypothetical protein